MWLVMGNQQKRRQGSQLKAEAGATQRHDLNLSYEVEGLEVLK